MPPGFQRAYHARNIRDEDEVISFGLFDMPEDDYRRWRADTDAADNQRVDQLSAFVENEHVSGVYEVVDTVDPVTHRRAMSNVGLGHSKRGGARSGPRVGPRRRRGRVAPGGRSGPPVSGAPSRHVRADRHA